MPTMIDKYDAKREIKNLKGISKLRAITKLDGSFQRYGGHDRGSGWSLLRGTNYLINLLLGATFNTIINVDVIEAHKYAHEQGDKESINYFGKLLDEGYKLLSVDGNNSSSYIDAFVKDNAKILLPGPDGTCQRFSDFTEEEQEDIKYVEKVEVITLRRISIMEVCDLFRHLNTSDQLRPQEWRQARWSLLSEFIREVSNGTKRTLFKHLVFNKDEDLDKRYHEEMVAQLALKVLKEYEGAKLTKSGLDTFYEDTSSLGSSVEKKVTDILAEVYKMALAIGSLKKNLTKGKLHNLFDVVQILTLQQNFKILDYKKFFNWFLEKDSNFTLQSKNVTEADKEEKSYEYWTVTYHKSKWYKKTRALFENALAQDMDDLVAKKIVKAPSRYFTWQQKLALLRLQGGKTREGENITYLDLYLGELEADHVQSLADGGETTIENGELMTMAANRKKGATSNEPHFPYQSS